MLGCLDLLGIFMVKNLKLHFANSLLAGAAMLPAFAFGQDTPQTAPQKSMSVRDASILLQKANRVAEDLLMAAIVGSTSSTGKVIAGTSIVDVGLTKASCEKLKDELPYMVNLETYKAAQAVMVNAGHLTPALAAQNLKTQTDFLQIAESLAPKITNTCNTLGVTLDLGLHHNK